MPTLTESLVARLRERRDEIRGAPVQRQARYYLLDWLGALLAAHGTDTGAKFTAYALAQPPGKAPLVGLGRGAAAETSAFYGGALSHIVEMDDVAREAIIHPAVVVMPAALAIAGERGASGTQLLGAIAEGYEAAILVGEAVGREHYYHFHNTTTCGVFGSAMAAGRLLDLDDHELVWALGNAGTQAFGLWQFNAEGVLTKPYHSGRAAAAGVSAALLAQAGVSGAAAILEGERGFFAGLAPGGDPQRIRCALEAGGPPRIGGVSIKPYASCRHTHAPIDAALRLRERLRGRVREISSVRVASYQAALTLCDNPSPVSTAEAKFSLQHCLASALLRGRAGLAQFEGEALHDADVRALAGKGTACLDEEAERGYPNTWSASVTLRLDNGESLAETVSDPKGDPENPLSQGELEEKFRELAAYGGVPASHADDLIAWVAQLGGDGAVDLEPLHRVVPSGMAGR
ncbi:MAG: MmgE/PrpD family protein [Pseudomonadota bacterium]|nr:MmgE/PrpD family protein [Pseudomonadota bacterium]